MKGRRGKLNNTSIPVYLQNANTKEILSFESMRLAAEFLNVYPITISEAVQNNCKIIKGYFISKDLFTLGIAEEIKPETP